MKFSEFLTETQEDKPQQLLAQTPRGDYIYNNLGITELPQFPKSVPGYVDLSNNHLTSLEGSPEHVANYFTCDSNELSTLEGAPKTVESFFSCKNNRITSLKHSPLKVGAVFDADNNLITSVEGITPVTTAVYLSNNKLESLHNVHKHITMTRQAHFDGNPIKSHVLGLLLIKNLYIVSLDNDKINRIINSYLPNTRGNEAVYECQEELIDAGYDEYAQL